MNHHVCPFCFVRDTTPTTVAVVVYELGVSDAEAAVAALNDRFRRRFTRPRKREGIARLSRRGYTNGPWKFQTQSCHQPCFPFWCKRASILPGSNNVRMIRSSYGPFDKRTRASEPETDTVNESIHSIPPKISRVEMKASWVISDLDSVAPPPPPPLRDDRSRNPQGRNRSREREQAPKSLPFLALGRKTEDGCPSTLRQV